MNREVPPMMLQPAENAPGCAPSDAALSLPNPPLEAPQPLEPLEPLDTCRRELDAVLASLDS